MNDLSAPGGEVVDKQTVRFRRLLPGPVERVWAYLTEPDKRAKWFAGGEFELRPGGKAELFFQHANLMQPGETAPEKYAQAVTGMSFIVRITLCEPPYALAYSWGEGDDVSEVLFELAPQGDKVMLTLTHSRLPSREEMLDVSGGWHTHLDILADVLRGRTPEPFWAKVARLEAEYDKRIPR